ncbi:MAG: hypothetical protein QHC67_02805 [Sphingobium sp.]|nr:hypothetical protein [Sphingobium sp.]MDX3908729.1 hypothetical protein [Sphingobium sp.]
MIHLTLILVDLFTGLIEAGGWALLIVGSAITGILGLGWAAAAVFRRRRS